MKRPMIRIHNTEINEIIDREMDDVEFVQYKKDVEQYEARKAEAKTKALAKSALLAKLGLTEDEAKLLVS